MILSALKGMGAMAVLLAVLGGATFLFGPTGGILGILLLFGAFIGALYEV